MFQLLEASDPRGRLGELGRFLEYWFGPRQPGFGEPAGRVRARPLPSPLAWFYEFAGRWPPGVPGYELEDFFYTGAGLHHLYPLDMVKPRPDGRLEFYGEYQGDWIGLTLAAGEDPPVWIEGRWIEENGDDRSGEKLVCSSLSRFLVTHCLMALRARGCEFAGSGGHGKRSRSGSQPVRSGRPAAGRLVPRFAPRRELALGCRRLRPASPRRDLLPARRRTLGLLRPRQLRLPGDPPGGHPPARVAARFAGLIRDRKGPHVMRWPDSFESSKGRS